MSICPFVCQQVMDRWDHQDGSCSIFIDVVLISLIAEQIGMFLIYQLPPYSGLASGGVPYGSVTV